EAKVMQAEARQKQIIDLQTTQILIGADTQIKELPPLEKHTAVVTGGVDESGHIAQPQEAVSTPVSTALDKLIQAIEAQTANTGVIDTGPKTSSDISDSVTISTTVETIAPPTATLAFAEASTFADLATGFIPRPDSTASRYYAAVAQASSAPISASTNTNVSLQSELYVEDDLLAQTGFIQPQYLGYQQARYVDFSV
ncbi:MAG: putative metalloprotease CJM1_0395 family protein, partial [Shewanella sp.]